MGIKYNPSNGGPADTDLTSVIEKRATNYWKIIYRGVKRLSLMMMH